MLVGERMSSPVVSIPANTPINEALNPALLVLVGIIRHQDLIADGKGL